MFAAAASALGFGVGGGAGRVRGEVTEAPAEEPQAASFFQVHHYQEHEQQHAHNVGGAIPDGVRDRTG